MLCWIKKEKAIHCVSNVQNIMNKISYINTNVPFGLLTFSNYSVDVLYFIHAEIMYIFESSQFNALPFFGVDSISG